MLCLTYPTSTPALLSSRPPLSICTTTTRLVLHVPKLNSKSRQLQLCAAAPAAGAAEEATNAGNLVLPSGLRPEAMPKHVAIVMDGNGRWARQRGLPSSAGHDAGHRVLLKVARHSVEWGIRVLTVFVFSTENWQRHKLEVDFLMVLLERVLMDNINTFLKENIRVHVIGDTSTLPGSVQRVIREVQEVTKNNTQIDLVLAISYSGRRDLVHACQKIAQKVNDQVLKPEDIDESLFAKELETSCITEFPYPDLLIRTSGELRLSNFLLWQSAYSELFFTDTLWPDFGEVDYIEALQAFQTRQRRFGLRKT